MNRRIYGMLAKRLDEAALGDVPDGRDARGQRWPLEALLRAVVGGMLAGKKSLAEVEALSTRLSAPVRRPLGARRRVPDTTLRDALGTLEPGDMRKPLHALTRAAHRRKALAPDELPFGVAAFDGKHFSIPASDDWYAQRQIQGDGAPLVGVVRTVTVVLTSCPARPVIDVVPIPARTNEMGVFPAALDAFCEAYAGLDLCEIVTYDAGACSAQNGAHVRARGLHYLFGLKGTQPTLYEEARRWLGPRAAEQADAVTEDYERGQRVVRRLYLGEVTVNLHGWEHLRTVVRVETETFDARGTLLGRDERYLVSSLPRCRLTAAHWLLVIRRHWGVETAHQILDTAFVEDDHPWIESNPRAALVVAILRRVAYTILALFRSITQRSEERRRVPWKALLEDVFFALVSVTDAQLGPRAALAEGPD